MKNMKKDNQKKVLIEQATLDKYEQQILDLQTKVDSYKSIIERATLNEHEQRILDLQTKLDLYKAIIDEKEENIRLLTKRLFGTSSEKIKTDDKKPQVFNDVEVCEKVKDKPVSKVSKVIKEDNRTAKKSRSATVDTSNLETAAEIDVKMSQEEIDELSKLGKVSDSGVVTVEKVIVETLTKKIVFNLHTKKVEGQYNEDGNPITFYPKFDEVIKGSIVTPKLLTRIILYKFAYALPLYRLEELIACNNFKPSRQVMCFWLARVWDNEISLLYKRIEHHLLKSSIIHADESPLQIINNPKGNKKGYIWLFQAGRGNPPMAVFKGKPGRGKENIEDFIKDYRGYLCVDGYEVYTSLAKQYSFTIVNCLAHIRRVFNDIAIATSYKSETAITGVNFCSTLFILERMYTDENRLEMRRKYSKIVFDRFNEWLMTLQNEVSKGTKIGKAINYAATRLPSLRAIFDDANLKLSNNDVEQNIRRYTVGRKNWLFVQSERGATISAGYYTLVVTAIQNNVDLEEYFTYVLTEMSKINSRDIKITDEFLDNLLPFSENIQKRFALKEEKHVNWRKDPKIEALSEETTEFLKSQGITLDIDFSENL